MNAESRVFKPLPAHPSITSEAVRLAPELPFDDIWTPEPEASLVIPGWGIAPGPPHLVTGSWYTGKTLLLATLGLSVASGRDLFGLWAVKHGKWLHFDHEMGKRQLKRYVQRLQRGMNIEPETIRGNVSLRVLPQLNLRTDKALDHYTELLTGVTIATLDPLRAAAPGSDENKSEFREHLDMLSIVSDRTGCSIVVLHHGGKPTEGAQRRNTGRGTSAIDDAVQTKVVLTSEEKGAPMLVTMEKSRELNQPLEDFYLEFANTPDSVALVHRLPDELGPRESAKADALTQQAVARLLEVFATHQGQLAMSREDVRLLAKMRTERFGEAWSSLLANGRLTRSGNYHQPIWKVGT